MSAQYDTTAIDEDGIRNTGSADRVTHVQEISNQMRRAKTLPQPKPNFAKHNIQREGHDNDTAKNEYFVEQIVNYISEEDALCYVVH